jgi:hypothetical protein
MVEALGPVFANIVNAKAATRLSTIGMHESGGAGRLAFPTDQLRRDAGRLARAARDLAGPHGRPTPVDDFVADLESGLSWTTRLARDPAARVLPPLNPTVWLALLAWLAIRGMGGPPEVPDRNRRCRQRMIEWRLDNIVNLAFREIGLDDLPASRATEAVAAIQELPMWSPDRNMADASAVIASWLADEGVRRVLGVRRNRSVDSFVTEAYDELVAWTTWVAGVRLAEYPQAYQHGAEPMIDWVAALSRDLLRAGATAHGRVDELIASR